MEDFKSSLDMIKEAVQECTKNKKRVSDPIKKKVVAYLERSNISKFRLANTLSITPQTITRWVDEFGKEHSAQAEVAHDPAPKPLPTKDSSKKRLVEFKANGVDIVCKVEDLQLFLEGLTHGK